MSNNYCLSSSYPVPGPRTLSLHGLSHLPLAAGCYRHPILQNTTPGLWEMESLVQAHRVSALVKVSVSPVLVPLTIMLYGLGLEFGWKACNILSAGAKGMLVDFVFSGEAQDSQFRVRWADFRVERAVGEGPEGAWEGPDGPAGFPHGYYSSLLTQSLGTKPPAQILHNCLIWPSEQGRGGGTFIFH